MKNKLFPEMQPLAQGWLEVGDGHEIHWQTSGNPEGMPVVWLHGGPGSSASSLHRRFLDPTRFWIIQYDQRGCGRSRPSGSVHRNETVDLIADIERLRQFLGVSRWSVVGGSWGGALALLYAFAHADRVVRMLLRSPFLCTQSEIENFMEHPPKECRDLWMNLKTLVPPSSRQTILEYGYQVFCQDQDTQEQARLAHAWVSYEAAMNVYPATAPVLGMVDGMALISRYRVQSHYLKHRCFVNEDLLAQATVLKEIPLTLVHGELDALCPYTNSLSIQRVAPQAKLVLVKGGGHDLTDPGILTSTFEELERWH
ncbi:MAG: alpha/beta fold hydrolase [Burkholderiales bacterium]|jgi:proline iminopeptidase|nr:alpha/beta fold hydrolase [Burkholderiales bacterium]MDP4909553.1 alpha/beta fold hydrolase [Burkholderiaceae bacterium]MDP4969136.1 alpha/beta fold hydrolase [Burkholderiaceae bacterium]